MSTLGVERSAVAYSHGKLAVATPDGRLKVYDGQRLLLDLTELASGSVGRQASDRVITALAWGQGPAHRFLALGEASGRVTCIDTDEQTISWGPTGVVECALAAVAVGAGDSPAVLAVGADGAAAVLELATGRTITRFQALKHGASQAAMVTGDRALVAGTSLVLLDVAAGGQRLRKWAGHAAKVVALAATPDAAFCCTLGEGEHQVAVWCLAPAAGKPKQAAAVGTVLVEQPALELCCSQVQAGSHFYLAAVLRDGGLVVYRVAARPGAAGVQQELVAQAASSSKVFHVDVEESSSGSGVTLAIAAGNPGAPVLHRIDGVGSAAEALQIDLDNSQGGLFAGAAPGSKRQQAGGGAGAQVLGVPAQAVIAVKSGSKRAAPTQDEDEDMDVVAPAVPDGGDIDEPTLGDRLRMMGGVRAPSAPEQQPQQESGAPVKADSLSVLLTQALRSRDNALLEKCLSVGHDSIITNSVQRLLPLDAALLVKAVLQRLQSAPARGEQLVAWVRAVLLHHTGFLVGMQSMQGSLNYLYQLIDARLATFQPLLALSGRLDVLLTHTRQAAAAAAEEYDFAQPLVVAEVGPDGIEYQDGFGAAADSDSEGESEVEEEEEEGLSGEGGSGGDDAFEDGEEDDLSE